MMTMLFFFVSLFQESTSVASMVTTAEIIASKDSEIPIISEEAYERFSFVMNAVTIPIVCVVGLTANLLGLCVLFRASKLEKLTIHIYLCFLTCLDSLFLTLGFIRSIPKCIHFYDKYLGNSLEVHSNLGLIYVDMILTYATGSVIAVMAVERSFALIRPFALKDFVLTNYPKTIVFLCVVGNAILLCPFQINFEVGSFQDSENRTEYYLRYKEYAESFMDAFTIFHTVVNNFIPGVTLIGATIAMLASLSQYRKRGLSQQRQSSIGRKQMKITIAVLCITIFYFLFSIPEIFIKTVSYFDKDYSFSGRYRLSFWLLMDISNAFSYLSAANDFVIYILVSDQYRKIFVEMYCVCRKGKENSYIATIPEVSERQTDRTSVNE